MIERAIERMLETENLTASLQDDDARWLLDWGIAQVRQLLKDVTDGDIADEMTYNLMSAMRTASRIAAEPTAVTTDNVHSFLENFNKAFGRSTALSPDAEQRIVASLSSKTVAEVIQLLIRASQPPGNDPQSTARSTSTTEERNSQ